MSLARLLHTAAFLLFVRQRCEHASFVTTRSLSFILKSRGYYIKQTLSFDLISSTLGRERVLRRRDPRNLYGTGVIFRFLHVILLTSNIKSYTWKRYRLPTFIFSIDSEALF